jgi:hypothetical protein
MTSDGASDGPRRAAGWSASPGDRSTGEQVDCRQGFDEWLTNSERPTEFALQQPTTNLIARDYLLLADSPIPMAPEMVIAP